MSANVIDIETRETPENDNELMILIHLSIAQRAMQNAAKQLRPPDAWWASAIESQIVALSKEHEHV